MVAARAVDLRAADQLRLIDALVGNVRAGDEGQRLPTVSIRRPRALPVADRNRSARRSLDLLLANADDSPSIYTELKIPADKPSYFALAQLLALAADLLPAAQRDRLQHHAGAAKLKSPDEGPYADLYIVTLNAPATGAYRSRSFSATKTISENLIADKRFSAQVRRIAYLEAVPEASGLTFHSRFAYGDRP